MDNGRIYIASDHNGNAARAYIIRLLWGRRPVVDLGPFEADGKVDYVDYAVKVCRSVLDDDTALGRGILVCGTGTGMSITANRFHGIRAGLATDRATAYLMREHNNANVIVLGQWRTPLGMMDEIIETFLSTDFGGGRHIERLRKLEWLRP